MASFRISLHLILVFGIDCRTGITCESKVRASRQADSDADMAPFDDIAHRVGARPDAIRDAMRRGEAFAGRTPREPRTTPGGMRRRCALKPSMIMHRFRQLAYRRTRGLIVAPTRRRRA